MSKCEWPKCRRNAKVRIDIQEDGYPPEYSIVYDYCKIHTEKILKYFKVKA